VRLARWTPNASAASYRKPAASALNHPNIVTIYDIGQADVGDIAADFIAMELVNGKATS
jgi:hypothetical protein